MQQHEQLAQRLRHQRICGHHELHGLKKRSDPSAAGSAEAEHAQQHEQLPQRLRHQCICGHHELQSLGRNTQPHGQGRLLRRHVLLLWVLGRQVVDFQLHALQQRHQARMHLGEQAGEPRVDGREHAWGCTSVVHAATCSSRAYHPMTEVEGIAGTRAPIGCAGAGKYRPLAKLQGA